MSREFLGPYTPQDDDEDIYGASAVGATRTNAAVGKAKRLYSQFENKPTTAEILAGISQTRMQHNFKENILLRIKQTEHKIVNQQRLIRDIGIQISWMGPDEYEDVNSTMTTRVLATTDNIRRLHNEREDVIFQLRESVGQLQDLKTQLRDINRTEEHLMRRLDGIEDHENVDDAIARQLQNMEQ
uniref:Uncharacterized protein n=1 Tax=Branchiostoma floridae TaxID=7739 RepID=C3YG69_BRAFL|eukprot:XP_002604579.1 hypothetical protein BRAFLDRAFT_92801 [Branchiostoma floridae]